MGTGYERRGTPEEEKRLQRKKDELAEHYLRWIADARENKQPVSVNQNIHVARMIASVTMAKQAGVSPEAIKVATTFVGHINDLRDLLERIQKAAGWVKWFKSALNQMLEVVEDELAIDAQVQKAVSLAKTSLREISDALHRLKDIERNCSVRLTDKEDEIRKKAYTSFASLQNLVQ